jgi:hypothetical protein
MPVNISIVASPAAISSAYRPLIFRVQSSAQAPELQIRGEVYVKTSPEAAYVMVAVKQEKKYLGNDYFIFDLSNTLQAYLTFDRLTAIQLLGIITPNNGSAVKYKVKFVEVYYDGNGFPADYSSVWSAELTAVNAIPQHTEEQALTNYIIWGGEGNSFSPGFNENFG